MHLYYFFACPIWTVMGTSGRMPLGEIIESEKQGGSELEFFMAKIN
jgi:hypothetical protein